ncbi:MAG: hypothetical protein C0624_09925 [Desulfuromonas sp.]|nr:MAG: hypothetical protein C0624_09925 [Desulfuromonas sp.]
MRPLCCIFLLPTLLLAACMMPPQLEPLQLSGETVIDGPAQWHGEVRIDGRVIVTRSGSLSIAPGTKVLFMPRDDDGDGIGDGELLIEGSLAALGTREQPILFTSGSESPQPADWKFLYLDFARHGELNHVISEYAYSGVQVHFCKATIHDSVFRHNVDGVRFSTVNLELAYNDIYGNTHGIRYEERRGKAQVHHNDIRDNDIGIFVVTRAEDRSRFEFNNLAGNRYYSVKMGLTQSDDISLPRNWWGTTDVTAIAETLLDARVDSTLGEVHVREPLMAPLEDAGRRK